MSSRDHPDWWRPTGGQNSQDSILERRSLVWNDNGILDGAVPDTFYEAEVDKGKFFTRGCRGMIEQIQLYCIGDGVDIITLRYSPHPCLGPINEVTLVPAAAWAWQDIDIEEMWDYDSLFIWVHEAEANVDWAYDAELPFDGHETADAGATWADMAIRPFIRVVYTGETPGDVPVSGILNVIKLPAVSSEVELNSENVPINTDVLMYERHGIGHCDLIFAHAAAAGSSEMTRLMIYCDDVEAFNLGFNNLNTRGVLANTPRISLLSYAVDGFCCMLITHKFEFRRSLRLVARNNFGAVFATVEVYPTLLR